MDFNKDTNTDVSFKSVWFVNTESDYELKNALSSHFKDNLQELTSINQFVKTVDSYLKLPSVLVIDSLKDDVDLLLPEYTKYTDLFSKIKVLLVTSEQDDAVITEWMSRRIHFYIRKPFSLEILRQNIDHIMKHSESTNVKEFNLGDEKIFLDLGNLSLCNKNNQLAALTKKEFMILSTLLESHGNWLSKESLLELGWPNIKVGLKTIDVHILHLRRKIQPLHLKIINKRRLGYRIISSRDLS